MTQYSQDREAEGNGRPKNERLIYRYGSQKNNASWKAFVMDVLRSAVSLLPHPAHSHFSS